MLTPTQVVLNAIFCKPLCKPQQKYVMIYSFRDVYTLYNCVIGWCDLVPYIVVDIYRRHLFGPTHTDIQVLRYI